MFTMIKEFKEFALRGNVIDLAVGVIIGGAFGKIISSLVNDVLMPVLGMILGGVSFIDLKYIITPANGDIAEVAILYGTFIQSIIDFVIIVFSIFIFIKLLTSIRKKEVEEAPAEPEAPVKGNEEILLEEIRDLLKEK